MPKQLGEFPVICSWCKEQLRSGDDTLPPTHSCCCSCKAKYFSTWADASDCQMEVISLEHEMMADGTAPRDLACHITVSECKVCKRLEENEPVPCDCENDRED